MAQTITTVSIPGTDEKGNNLQLRIEVPRIELEPPSKLQRVPKVIHAREGEKLDDAVR